jgi:putative transposase
MVGCSRADNSQLPYHYKSIYIGKINNLLVFEMQTAYKFRLYPSAEEEKKLLFILEVCRLLYNSFLAIWNASDKIPSKRELQAMLPAMKEEHEGMKKVNAKTLQMVLFMLYNNLKALHELKKNGRKVGRLRYKKYGKFRSFILNQSGFKVIKTGKRLDRLYISKVGNVPIRIHREIEGKIKQVIIKRYPCGDWYALFCVDKQIPVMERAIQKVVGLDMGIRFFLTDSESRQIENPKFYKRTLERIKIEQRRLSKKKRRSNNWLKQLMKVNKLYQRLVNQRDDFLHKLSRFYVDNYDLIAVEDLNINGMVRNHHLSQSILDASWSKFFGMLSYKAASAGKIVQKVNPRGTSREYKYGKIDRDYNAALNILERGISGQGMPFAPVEMRPLLVEIPASLVVEAGTGCLRLQS